MGGGIPSAERSSEGPSSSCTCVLVIVIVVDSLRFSLRGRRRGRHECGLIRMYRLQKIESFDLPELQPYRTMRRQHEHRQQGIFVAEGEKVVRRLLESKLQRRLGAAPGEMAAGIGAAPAGEAGRRFRCSWPRRRCSKRSPASRCTRACWRWGRFRHCRRFEEIVARSPQPRLLAAADGLSSAENLGALVRNCAAFSAQALIVGETCSSPFLRRAVRSSMGTIFQLPIVESASLIQAPPRPARTRHSLHRRPSAR